MGPVRAPDEAGSGSARVTASFPSWKEARVAPATYPLSLPTGDSAKD